jgi:hypothetical protein
VGMGWVRTELPGSLGAVGCNGMSVKELPIVGEGGPESLVIYHQGSMAGYTSSIFLLPTTDITVVVLKLYSTQRSSRLGRRTSPGSLTRQPKSSRSQAFGERKC